MTPSKGVTIPLNYHVEDQQQKEVAIQNNIIQTSIHRGTYYYFYGAWWMDKNNANIDHGDAF